MLLLSVLQLGDKMTLGTRQLKVVVWIGWVFNG